MSAHFTCIKSSFIIRVIEKICKETTGGGNSRLGGAGLGGGEGGTVRSRLVIRWGRRRGSNRERPRSGPADRAARRGKREDCHRPLGSVLLIDRSVVDCRCQVI